MTPLTDLDAQFVQLMDDNGLEHKPDAKHAHGLWLECPGCHNHRILVWFANPLSPPPVDETHSPPGRWTRSGTTLGDLTLAPSILIIQPCGWHGWVRDGKVINC